MIRWRLVGAFCAIFGSYACAELEGIAFNIPYVGSYPQTREALELTDEESDAFTSFRVSSKQELKDLWQEMRRELGQVKDEAAHVAWRRKYGPLIRQINYDLWQKAVEILKTEERTKKYHRMLVQDYLKNGRDIRCIASLIGANPSWNQYAELREKLQKTPFLVDNRLAERRRELEEELLGEILGADLLREKRGAEFEWTSRPPDLDSRMPGFLDERLQADNSLIKIGSHDDVVQSLKVSAESEKILKEAFADSGGREEISGYFKYAEILQEAKTDEQRKAVIAELEKQRKDTDKELADTLKSVLTPTQFARLQQIGVQLHLRSFQYTRVAVILGHDVDDELRRKLENLGSRARREIDYARIQTSIDMNAEIIDKVLETNLVGWIGKVEGHFTSPFRGLSGQGDLSKERELFRKRYGKAPTAEFSIPKSLSTAPKDRIAWNDVDVPEGWDLEDAYDNLERWQRDAEKVIQSSRAWEDRRDELRRQMLDAVIKKNVELKAKLQTEYQSEFGIRYFETKRQFREAAKIAQEELSRARRIVRKLGGDPGDAKDISVLIR